MHECSDTRVYTVIQYMYMSHECVCDLHCAGKAQLPAAGDAGDDVTPLPTDVARKLCLIAARCLCELLVTHPHFNCRTDVIATVVPLLTSGGAEVSVALTSSPPSYRC